MTHLLRPRLLLLLLLAGLALLTGASAPSARADGDPASDFLLTQNVFASYTVSAALQHDLTVTTAQMRRAGDPIKVAIISTQADLGAITPLFGNPRAYAEYLGIEIRSGPAEPLLVVMADGYGSVGLRPAARAAVAGLPLPGQSTTPSAPTGRPGDRLARAALVALGQIAAANGHPLPRPYAANPVAPTVPFRVAVRSALGLLLIIGLAGAAWLGFLSLSWHGHKLSERARRTFASDSTRALQTALGLLWLLDGGLHIGAGFTSQVSVRLLNSHAAGQPAWFAECLRWAARVISHGAVAWNVLFTAVAILIGIGLLWPRSVKLALVLSSTWALLIWVFAEGLGGMLIGAAQPLAGAPGAGVLYVLVSVLAWPSARPGAVISSNRVRLVWGGLWLGMAWLWLSGANSDPAAITQTLNRAPSGMSWLSSLQEAAAHAAGGHGLVIALTCAAASAAIGITVARGSRWTSGALLVSVTLSGVYWVFGQGFGGLLTGRATDPGAGPLFVVLAYCVYATVPPPADGLR